MKAKLDAKEVEGMVLKSKITVAIRVILELGGDPFNVSHATLENAIRDLGDSGKIRRAEFVGVIAGRYVDLPVDEAMAKHVSPADFSKLVEDVLNEEQFVNVLNREKKGCYNRLCGSFEREIRARREPRDQHLIDELRETFQHHDELGLSTLHKMVAALAESAGVRAEELRESDSISKHELASRWDEADQLLASAALKIDV